MFVNNASPGPQRNRVHVDVWVPYDQAEVRIAAALAAGGRLVNDTDAPSNWVLADPETHEACVGVAGPPGLATDHSFARATIFSSCRSRRAQR
ncbi:VOC family protein [Streptomyces lydicus]|uniref:VOC family protein n=1 Tax=Streptomyces lydicus TaxID=47763 RepID=UPI0037B92B4E